MRIILHLSCSPRLDDAYSRSFSNRIVARLLALHPGAGVIHRDLGTDPPPLVDAGFSAAILASPILASPILAPPGTVPPALAASETLIRELESADALVIGTPMHNFGVPAVLKAWVDQIVRIHRSFASTPTGKVGLLTDRPVYIAVASGGWFTGPSPTGAPPQPDFLTPYLTAVLNTIGIRDLNFFTLEGVARGPEIREAAFGRATLALDRVLPPYNPV